MEKETKRFNIGDIVYFIPDAEKGIISKHKIHALYKDPLYEGDISYSSVALESTYRRSIGEDFLFKSMPASSYTFELEHACSIAERYFKERQKIITACRKGQTEISEESPKYVKWIVPKQEKDEGIEELPDY